MNCYDIYVHICKRIPFCLFYNPIVPVERMVEMFSTNETFVPRSPKLTLSPEDRHPAYLCFTMVTIMMIMMITMIMMMMMKMRMMTSLMSGLTCELLHQMEPL